MTDNKLVTLSMDFAIAVVYECRQIKATTKETILTNQLLRSGTSIGANIREANYAVSKADFIAKLHIALKECYESEYWIELLQKTNSCTSERGSALLKQCGALRRILIASINTAKSQ